eukprot:616586-Rhodomonas_salina.1
MCFPAFDFGVCAARHTESRGERNRERWREAQCRELEGRRNQRREFRIVVHGTRAFPSFAFRFRHAAQFGKAISAKQMGRCEQGVQGGENAGQRYLGVAEGRAEKAGL